MNTLASFLHEYGYVVVFSASLLEQIGLPLPSSPIFIAAGIAAGMGDVRLAGVVGAGIAGSMIGDVLWYFLGLWRGHQVLKFLCRLSIEPDSCVRDTEERFLRYGVSSLAVAKFVPGIGTLIRPLAAIAGVGLDEFLLYTGTGTVLYVGLFTGLGYLFSDKADVILRLTSSTGYLFLDMLLIGALLYLTFKLFKRRQFLNHLATARLPAEELKQKMDAGQPVVIVDLRTPLQMKAFPYTIPGALKIPLRDIEAAYSTIPTGRDVVLFCDCPNEVSSAKAALFLKKKGFASARPLTGGIDVWKERTYPLEALAMTN